MTDAFAYFDIAKVWVFGKHQPAWIFFINAAATSDEIYTPKF
jgi:hypothetical protein